MATPLPDVLAEPEVKETPYMRAATGENIVKNKGYVELNLSVETELSSGYDTMDRRLRIANLVTEVMQNIMDWVTTMFAKKDPAATRGLQSYLDFERGLLVGRAVRRIVDERAYHIEMIRDSEVGMEAVIHPRTGELLLLQIGQGMLDAKKFLPFGSTTKSAAAQAKAAAAATEGKGEAKQEPAVAEGAFEGGGMYEPATIFGGAQDEAFGGTDMFSAWKKSEAPEGVRDALGRHIPQAGGHGMGFKQLISLMLASHWEISISGTYRDAAARGKLRWSHLRPVLKDYPLISMFGVTLDWSHLPLILADEEVAMFSASTQTAIRSGRVDLLLHRLHFFTPASKAAADADYQLRKQDAEEDKRRQQEYELREHQRLAPSAPLLKPEEKKEEEETEEEPFEKQKQFLWEILKMTHVSLRGKPEVAFSSRSEFGKPPTALVVLSGISSSGLTKGGSRQKITDDFAVLEFPRRGKYSAIYLNGIALRFDTQTLWQRKHQRPQPLALAESETAVDHLIVTQTIKNYSTNLRGLSTNADAANALIRKFLLAARMMAGTQENVPVSDKSWIYGFLERIHTREASNASAFVYGLFRQDHIMKTAAAQLLHVTGMYHEAEVVKHKEIFDANLVPRPRNILSEKGEFMNWVTSPTYHSHDSPPLRVEMDFSSVTTYIYNYLLSTNSPLAQTVLLTPTSAPAALTPLTTAAQGFLRAFLAVIRFFTHFAPQLRGEEKKEGEFEELANLEVHLWAPGGKESRILSSIFGFDEWGSSYFIRGEEASPAKKKKRKEEAWENPHAIIVSASLLETAELLSRTDFLKSAVRALWSKFKIYNDAATNLLAAHLFAVLHDAPKPLAFDYNLPFNTVLGAYLRALSRPLPSADEFVRIRPPLSPLSPPSPPSPTEVKQPRTKKRTRR